MVAKFSHRVNFWVRCASGNVFLIEITFPRTKSLGCSNIFDREAASYHDREAGSSVRMVPVPRVLRQILEYFDKIVSKILIKFLPSLTKNTNNA